MKTPLSTASRHRFLFGFILALGLACATTGPGGKKSLIFIGGGTEVSMGKQAEKEVLTQSKVLTDTVWQNYVSRVGQSLAQFSERKDVQYSFTVLESKDINAFALPGGPLYIYTGLLKLMEDEAELAAVLGHEIGHVDGRHAVRQMQPVVGLTAIEALAFGDKTPASRQALNFVLGIALTGYSRSHELEADRFGLSYMQRAGYDPNGSLRMFTKLGGRGKESGTFLKNFPPPTRKPRNGLPGWKGRLKSSRPAAKPVGRPTSG